MRRILIVLALGLLLCQCKKEAKQECDKEKPSGKTFKMYKMSEMAALMEQMYVDNQRLKERILKGDTIGKFPKHFEKILTAQMTDESDNDAFFKVQAEFFLKAQRVIYEDPQHVKANFDRGVDACLQCHKEKCGGPIPRIQKLYIAK